MKAFNGRTLIALAALSAHVFACSVAGAQSPEARLHAGLPMLDEPRHPSLQQYEHEHTKHWSASVAAARQIRNIACIGPSPAVPQRAMMYFANAVT